MIRKVLFAACALAVLVARAARATGVAVTFNQSASFQGGTSTASAGLSVWRQTDASDATGVAQSALASGYVTVCNPSCVFTQFPQQSIPDDAFQADPLGNTVTIDACLTPSSGPPCQTFAVTMSRPTTPLQQGVYPNAWVDPAAPAAHADAYGYLYRGQYTATGTTPAGTMPFPNGYLFSNYNAYVSAGATLG